MRKTIFVVMFFAIQNFEILFLVFSFFVNFHFSSRGTCAEEKCKFAKNENTKNKISKFRIAKNITTKNVLSVSLTFLFYFPDLVCKFCLLISKTVNFHHFCMCNIFVRVNVKWMYLSWLIWIGIVKVDVFYRIISALRR